MRLMNCIYGYKIYIKLSQINNQETMQGKTIEVIHIAKTHRTTARRNRCSADSRHTLHTRSYGGFEYIKAAVPYALNKGVTPIR